MAAKSKPASRNVLAELDAIEAKPGWHNWLNAHDAETRELLEEVRRRWQAGHYATKGTQKTQLYETLNTRFKLGITLQSFRNWLGPCAKS